MPSDDEPPRQLIFQRIRNRIIEYLQLASSFERQIEYQAAAPVSVPGEVINQWQDWVPDSGLDWLTPPVFTPDEAAAIASFNTLWEAVADDIPHDLVSLEAAMTLPAWHRLRSGAASALQVLERRGPLPEDRIL